MAMKQLKNPFQQEEMSCPTEGNKLLQLHRVWESKGSCRTDDGTK